MSDLSENSLEFCAAESLLIEVYILGWGFWVRVREDDRG